MATTDILGVISAMAATAILSTTISTTTETAQCIQVRSGHWLWHYGCICYRYCGSGLPDIGWSQSLTAQQQFATQPASQPTIAPTQTIFNVGETDNNTVWSMTLNSVKTSPGDQVDTPDAGMIYVVSDVTIGNLLSYSQDVSSRLSFQLQDSTGQAYDQDINYFRTSPDGPIQPASKLRGQLVYAVPKTMHDFTLQFQENGDGSSGTWGFTI